jgi:hypothetical protein
MIDKTFSNMFGKIRAKSNETRQFFLQTKLKKFKLFVYNVVGLKLQTEG